MITASHFQILLVLDDHYDNRAAQFMRILYHLVVAIARWFPTEPPEVNISQRWLNVFPPHPPELHSKQKSWNFI